MNVKRSTFERVFVDHIELWLSGLGLVIIFGVPQIVFPESGDRWRVTALTAVAVGVVHGIIFWIVRRRRQHVMQEAHDLVEEENARLEERVAERTEQVHALAADVSLAEQRERHRLSVVLHDDLQQLLFSIQMRVQALVEDAARTNGLEEANGPAARDAEYVHEKLAEAIEKTRNLSLELSPPVLAGEGLDQALEWLGHHMDETHGLEVRVENRASHPVTDESVRVLLFQLVRELLFNVVKHAETDRVRLMLEDGREDLAICVVDRGRGFDPDEEMEDHGSGMGLARIRKRLYFLGGSMDVESAPGEGTTVRIRAPKRLHLPESRETR